MLATVYVVGAISTLGMGVKTLFQYLLERMMSCNGEFNEAYSSGYVFGHLYLHHRN